MTDKVFDKEIDKQFEFDEQIASVFDDMLNRSVPFYGDVIKLITDMASKKLENGDTIYDLGCSTATTLIELQRKTKKDLKLIGVDNSEAMLKRAQNKSKAFNIDLDLYCDDIFNIDIKDAKLVLSNYTIQFIRPLQREKLIKKIYDGLDENGIFIFSEKIIYDDPYFHKDVIDLYYEFKKDQGYSEFEISQKREALENVLIPYSEEENKKMILDAGFKDVQIIFKWLNFATFIAIK